MDVEELMQKNPNVSRKEIENIRDNAHFFGLCEGVYERTVSSYHDTREYEKVTGKRGEVAGPLVHVVRVDILPYDINPEESLSIFGKIYTEFYDIDSGKMIVNHIYNSKFEDNEILKPDGSLTLTNDYDRMTWKLPCMPLHNTRIVVDVCVGGNTFSASFICFDEDMTDFERVKSKHVYSDFGALVLRYIAIPFAIYGVVDVNFHHKKGCQLDIQGKIVAGGNDLEKCTLFEKQNNEFERLNFDLRGTSLRFSRCLVSLPIYSSLVVDLDLSVFGSDCKFLKETIEFRRELMSQINFIVNDVLVEVSVNWLSTTPHGRPSCIIEPQLENESSDEEIEESCVPEGSSHLQIPWELGRHRSGPFPCSALVVFSIFIGRENFKDLQVYGCVELSSTTTSSVYGFNREADNAFRLSKGIKTIPVLNGFLSYEYLDSLNIKIDLKDVDGHMHIKGYVDWDDRSLEYGTHWLNKQLCSVVEWGHHDFVGVHYSIFPEALEANVGVVCMLKPKIGNEHNMLLKVHGSIIAQYNNFDYSSKYNKDYFRVVLFQRSENDPARTSGDGALILSRSTVVVPLYSSLAIEVILWIGDDQVLLCSTAEFQADTNDVLLENSDYCFHVYVKWT